MKKERLFFLDFIRAAATMLIVLWHFNTAILENHIVSSTFLRPNFANISIGHLGVSLFFIISGAALMHVYQESIDIKKYAKKRFLAIYPMFWIAYFCAFLFFFYKNRAIDHSIPKYRIIFTVLGMDGYVNANGIRSYYILGEWFLGCIIIFYIVFPFLRTVAIKAPVVLACAVLAIYFIMVNHYLFRIPIDWNIWTRLSDLVFGMLFIRYVKSVNFPLFAVSLLVFLLMLFVKIHIIYMYAVSLSGISLFFVLVFVGTQIKDIWIQKNFQFISRYSYPIFLTHHVIISQIQSHFSGVVLNKTELLCMFIITAILIGLFTYVLVRLNKKVVEYFQTRLMEEF